jgi:hypothetical protein
MKYTIIVNTTADKAFCVGEYASKREAQQYAEENVQPLLTDDAGENCFIVPLYADVDKVEEDGLI